MCRWFAYISTTEPCLLEDVLLEPEHSIARQVSDHYLPYLDHYEKGVDTKDTERQISLRNRLFNADGFGVAWYTDTRQLFEQCKGPRPIVYTMLRQPLTDPVFKSISANTAALTLFAHVRAASQSSPITTYNNHPFSFGRYLFMHNGGLGAFTKIRRGMINLMSQSAVERIEGTTDSEHLAMVFFTYLATRVGKHGDELLEKSHSLADVKAALEQAISDCIRLQHEYIAAESQAGRPVSEFEPSSLNIAITDGAQLFAIRFRNHETEYPPSLYFSTKAGATLNRCFPDHPDSWEKGQAHEQHSTNLRAKEEHGKHVIVSSEPITYKEKDWELVGKNECLMVDAHQNVTKEPVHVEL